MLKSPIASTVQIHHLGLVAYDTTLSAMRRFTDERTVTTTDELWILEHHPVFTQGQAGKSEHLLNPGCIPVIQSDRGGQVTYHGPGQLVMYLLIDLRRKEIGVKQLVCHIEQAVIMCLSDYGVRATTKKNAPGVYVDDAKICQLGLRIRKGCSYHGLSLNVDMDLEPFQKINPCGFPQLKVVKLTDFVGTLEIDRVASDLLKHLAEKLAYKVCLKQIRSNDNVQSNAN